MSVSSKKKSLAEEFIGKPLEEQIEWFDSHDTSEYIDEMPEVEIKVVHSNRSTKYRDKKTKETSAQLLKQLVTEVKELRTEVREIKDKLNKAD